MSSCSSAVCNVPVKLVCGGCQTIKYCSEECQRKHWSAHKPVCAAIRAAPDPIGAPIDPAIDSWIDTLVPKIRQWGYSEDFANAVVTKAKRDAVNYRVTGPNNTFLYVVSRDEDGYHVESLKLRSVDTSRPAVIRGESLNTGELMGDRIKGMIGSADGFAVLPQTDHVTIVWSAPSLPVLVRLITPVGSETEPAFWVARTFDPLR